MIIIIIINNKRVTLMQPELKNQYQQYIKNNNLKSSKRRDFIFDHIIENMGHFTIDDIYQQTLKIDPDIGIATIYRTIRLLVDSGILAEHTFGEKKGFYEINNYSSPDHGHLICIVCGKIIEFQCEFMENCQKNLTKKHEFKINSHKFEIFGICNECQKDENSFLSK